MLRLRRQLGREAGARIRTVAPGYRVDVLDGELDEAEFLLGCRTGHSLLARGDHQGASRALAAALALWRGDPLTDLPQTADVLVRVRQLLETRLTAWQDRIAADLSLGRHQELVPELRGLAGAHPLREALHGQLMLALYRSGRQAEALEAFQALRRTLVDELGVEPSGPLRHLHSRILGSDPALGPDPVPRPDSGQGGGAEGAEPEAHAPVTIPDGADAVAAASGPRNSGSGVRQLPADTRAFTGRSGELLTLLALAEQADAAGADGPDGPDVGTVVVSAIDGMGGVGKTALVVHAAHRLAERFPDGQLFLDLHGHTPGRAPLTSAEALGRLLRSLGADPRSIPGEPGERAAFYRDRLAGTRTLILLDNAASTAQVRPLLPGAPGSLVLITSRRRLAGLDDADPLHLDPLSRAEARALLHTVAGTERLPVGNPATEEIISLCGCLPQALRIIAARLRHHPVLRPEELAALLRDEKARLDHLSDGERSLVVDFDCSYSALPAAEQLLFRRLSLVPGADFDGCAAAALLGPAATGREPADAERLLESLLDRNLLVQQAPGRYRFHDLVQLYARGVAAGAGAGGPEAWEHEAARERLLDYYAGTEQPPSVTPAVLSALTLVPQGSCAF
ncbi:AfsR/SARP family transcriptional regulator [Streptacidiphilus cavernicola]|uniref:BTAD domain-containing putative transcriptional regulator n=1 Tax=Streptacidiphilus cavernicola TaxID=3342716 RepID=A0ABV6VQF7_9ACTN